MIYRVLAFFLVLLSVPDTFTRAQAAGALPSAPTADGKRPRVAGRPVVVAPEKSLPVRLARFETAPTIDGRLDEALWKQASFLKDFYQTQPGDNIPPSRPTEVLLGYDSQFLYIAFRAHDEPEKVRATIAKRDDIFSDDYVGVYLDTYDDQRRAYVLYFNPLGVQADSILTEGRGEDFSVDVVMESKGMLTPEGYTVEVAVPFKSLRYAAGPERAWGLHAIRVIKRFNGEQDSWMPISRDVSGFLNQGGHLTGIEQTWAGRAVEVIPTVTLSEAGRRGAAIPPAALSADPRLKDRGRFVNDPVNVDPGVTVRLSIAPAVTLDFAINPDFAQVEADQTVVTANQRFPIFFTEKRPFFLEGIDVFQTQLTPVHTRTIIDPDVAVKLTGKRGRNTFGLLLASDAAPGNFTGDERLEPGNFRFLDKNAYVGVVRLKRDVGRESNVGLIATSYNFIEKHNQLGGLDGRFRLDPQTVFDFQVLATTSRRFFYDPELDRSLYRTGNGFGYYWNLSKNGRHFGLNLNGQGKTRDYRADVGFTRRTNTNSNIFFVRYNSEPDPNARMTSWRLTYTAIPEYDWQGRLQSGIAEFQARFNFRHQSFFNTGANAGAVRVFEEEFGPKRTLTRAGAFSGDDTERTTHPRTFFVRGGATPSKKYSVFLLVSHTWGEMDLDSGAGLRFPRVSPRALLDPKAPRNPGPGDSLDISANVTIQPTNAWRTSLDYTRSRLLRRDTRRVAFDDHIYSLRSTYQFTRFTFARLRLDYTTLAARVSGQALVGWEPNPGTSFYVGYNDDLNHNGFNPFSGELERGLHRNGRTFFLKMSYLIRRNL